MARQYSLDPQSVLPKTEFGPFGELYFIAMTEHFWEYFWFSHTLPPLIYLRNGLLYNLVPPTLFQPISIAALSLSTALAGGLIYLAMRNLNIPGWFAFLTGGLLSLRLVAWDMWHLGDGWDIFNPAILALLIWAMSRDLGGRGIGAPVLSGFAGALLVGSFQPAVLAVFPAVFLFYVLSSPAGARTKRTLWAVGLPAVALGLILMKNGTQHGLWAPTSGAGQNIIQNLSLAVVDPRETGIIDYAETELNYPAWWVWCYREAERRGKWQAKHISGYYGACDHVPGGRSFAGLKSYLAANGPEKILDLVVQDEAMFSEKPWLYSGWITARITRFSIEYGKISARLHFDVLRRLPRAYAVRTYSNLKMFIRNGSAFETAVPEVKVRLPGFILAYSTLFKPVLMIGIVAMFIIAVLAPIWYLAALGDRRRIPPPSGGMILIWSAALAFSFGALASVGFHCCENGRHAMNYVPLVYFAGFSLIYLFAGSVRPVRPGKPVNR